MNIDWKSYFKIIKMYGYQLSSESVKIQHY